MNEPLLAPKPEQTAQKPDVNVKGTQENAPLKPTSKQFISVLIVTVLIAAGLSVAMIENTWACIIVGITFATSVVGVVKFRSEVVEVLKRTSVLKESKETKSVANKLRIGGISFVNFKNKWSAVTVFRRHPTSNATKATQTTSFTINQKRIQLQQTYMEIGKQKQFIYPICMGR